MYCTFLLILAILVREEKESGAAPRAARGGVVVVLVPLSSSSPFGSVLNGYSGSYHTFVRLTLPAAGRSRDCPDD